jgi:hypothetical protein
LFAAVERPATMDRRTTLGAGLILVGLILCGLALAFPVDPVRVHDTRGATNMNVSVAEEYDYRVVAYENLSERGQELYVKTLENGGVYRVPVGQGAEDFAYPDPAVIRSTNRSLDYRGLLIERPANDGHLPPADEHPSMAEDAPANESTVTRYESMSTRTTDPPLGSGAHVPRLLALALGIGSLTAGAYLLVSKP